MGNMREYRPGSSYKYITFFILFSYWLIGAMYIFTPIYYFIKHRISLDNHLTFSLYPVLYFFLILLLLLYQHYKLYRIKAKIDSQKIIYKNHRSTKNVLFSDIQKIKFRFYHNMSSIKVLTEKQKVKIFLPFEDAYKFVLEFKSRLDTSGKSELYSKKKLYKFVRMILNAEIMLKWGTKSSFMLIIIFFLVFILIQILPISETKLIITFSSFILSMIISIIPVFIIQNSYKKESDEANFFFPKRDMEFEKRVVKKGYIVFGLLLAVTIILILII